MTVNMLKFIDKLKCMNKRFTIYSMLQPTDLLRYTNDLLREVNAPAFAGKAGVQAQTT